MSVRTGDRAPGFALPAAPGEVVDVGEAIGRRPVVLLFFPLAFSAVCTREMGSVRDDWSRWEDLDAAVYAISVDSPFVTRKFRDEHDLPFRVLSPAYSHRILRRRCPRDESACSETINLSPDDALLRSSPTPLPSRGKGTP